METANGKTVTMKRVKELWATAHQAEQCLKTAHKLARAGVEVNTIEESYNLQPPPIAIYPA